jgi:hypothetical protein
MDLTRNGVLCNSAGEIGPIEFETIMRREMHSFVQTRLTDFSDCRTEADMELTSIGALKTLLSEVLRIANEQNETRREIRDTRREILENISQLRHTSPSSLCSLESAEIALVETSQLPKTNAFSESSTSTIHAATIPPETQTIYQNLNPDLNVITDKPRHKVDTQCPDACIGTQCPDACIESIDQQLSIRSQDVLIDQSRQTRNYLPQDNVIALDLSESSGSLGAQGIETVRNVTEMHNSIFISRHAEALCGSSCMQIASAARYDGLKPSLLPSLREIPSTLNTFFQSHHRNGKKPVPPVSFSGTWSPAVQLSQIMKLNDLHCQEHTGNASFDTTAANCNAPVDDLSLGQETDSVCNFQIC